MQPTTWRSMCEAAADKLPDRLRHAVGAHQLWCVAPLARARARFGRARADHARLHVRALLGVRRVHAARRGQQACATDGSNGSLPMKGEVPAMTDPNAPRVFRLRATFVEQGPACYALASGGGPRARAHGAARGSSVRRQPGVLAAHEDRVRRSPARGRGVDLRDLRPATDRVRCSRQGACSAASSQRARPHGAGVPLHRAQAPLRQASRSRSRRTKCVSMRRSSALRCPKP